MKVNTMPRATVEEALDGYRPPPGGVGGVALSGEERKKGFGFGASLTFQMLTPPAHWLNPSKRF